MYGDEVTPDFIKSILAAIDETKADYFPLKWRFMNWHQYVFVGCEAIPLIFTNIYKKDVALKIKQKSNINNLTAALCERECGKAIDKVIYMHWR